MERKVTKGKFLKNLDMMDFLDGTFDELIESMEMIKEEYPNCSNFSLDLEFGRWEGDNDELKLYADQLESDEDYQKRLNAEIALEAKERAEYERLKAKYENK